LKLTDSDGTLKYVKPLKKTNMTLDPHVAKLASDVQCMSLRLVDTGLPYFSPGSPQNLPCIVRCIIAYEVPSVRDFKWEEWEILSADDEQSKSTPRSTEVDLRSRNVNPTDDTL